MPVKILIHEDLGTIIMKITQSSMVFDKCSARELYNKVLIAIIQISTMPLGKLEIGQSKTITILIGYSRLNEVYHKINVNSLQ